MISINFTLLVQLANFLILLVVLNFLLFKPILRVLDEREKIVKESQEINERLGRLADENIEEYERKVYAAKQEAMGLRASVRKETLDDFRLKVQEAKTAGAEELEKARQKIVQQAEGSRKTLMEEARSLAGGIAEKLAGRAL